MSGCNSESIGRAQIEGGLAPLTRGVRITVGGLTPGEAAPNSGEAPGDTTLTGGSGIRRPAGRPAYDDTLGWISQLSTAGGVARHSTSGERLRRPIP